MRSKGKRWPKNGEVGFLKKYLVERTRDCNYKSLIKYLYSTVEGYDSITKYLDIFKLSRRHKKLNYQISIQELNK